MWTILLAVAIWSTIGVAIAIVHRRHGHNLLLFAAIAIWLGPLIVLVMASVSRKQENPPVRVLRTNGVGPGWIDVLVGVDGTEESIESVRAVMHMLGAAAGRVRVVSALDIETATSPTFFDHDDELERRLDETATRIGHPHAELAFVAGRADRALIEHAQTDGFDLLVVAHRSRRLRALLFGSTVERLARSATVPLIIGPPADRNSHPAPDVDLSMLTVKHPSLTVKHPSNKPLTANPPCSAASLGEEHVLHR